MVGGEFVEIHRDKGKDGSDGDEKSCGAEDGKQISPTIFHQEVKPCNQGGPCAQVKGEHRCLRRKGSDFRSQGFLGNAEKAAAARGDDIRFEAQEIACLEIRLSQEEGGGAEE